MGRWREHLEALQAIREAGRHRGPPRPLAEIRELLTGEPDKAARLLGECTEEGAVAMLGTLIRHEQPYARWQAVLSLTRRGGEAVVPLIAEALADPDWRVASTASLVLARMGTPKAIEALDQAAAAVTPDLDSSAEGASFRAVIMLGRMWTPTAKSLLRAVRRGDIGNAAARRHLERVLRWGGRDAPDLDR